MPTSRNELIALIGDIDHRLAEARDVLGVPLTEEERDKVHWLRDLLVDARKRAEAALKARHERAERHINSTGIEGRMSQPLMPRAAQCIEKLFPEPQREKVADLISKACGVDLPCAADRYQLAILKLSGGDFDELISTLEFARSPNFDWRDVLLAADFGDPLAHLSWQCGDGDNGSQAIKE